MCCCNTLRSSRKALVHKILEACCSDQLSCGISEVGGWCWAINFTIHPKNAGWVWRQSSAQASQSSSTPSRENHFILSALFKISWQKINKSPQTKSMCTPVCLFALIFNSLSSLCVPFFHFLSAASLLCDIWIAKQPSSDAEWLNSHRPVNKALYVCLSPVHNPQLVSHCYSTFIDTEGSEHRGL